MNRSKQIFFYHSFTDHDRILEVVTFPWHECHFQVLTEGELTILRCITFSKEITTLHLLSFFHSRFQVDTGFLVCLDELREPVNSQVIFKTYQLLLLITFVTDMYLICINKLDHAISFRVYLDPCIARSFS